MMKKLGTLAVIALALTGCSAQADATPTPSWTPTITGAAPNNVACRAFAKEWSAAVSSMTGDSTNADWQAHADAIDTIALKAEGDVKTRMIEFAGDWPNMFDVFVVHELDETNRRLGAIERACAASGETLDGLQIVAK